MRLTDRIRGTFSRRSRVSTARQELSSQLFLSPLCSTYENIFPQVRPLIDALKDVIPYGVDADGKLLPLNSTPELLALQDPNEEMGWAEFMDLAFAMWLTESELNIHVWIEGDRIKRVYGYSILPPGSRVRSGQGEYCYQVLDENGMTKTLDKGEVMSLRYSRNPRNIQQGVSPAQTVFVQTQIADLMYQYQRAYLENGAVPAYITIIRASTKEKFEEARHDFENSFKGADKKGKTAFLWRQFLDDGSEADQVEVKTIQPNNSTLAIKEIMSLVKDDFNKAFGVSEFILGNDSSAKYDNAELSQQQFMLHRVKPALRSFWTQFQHELDRILGGLGYAIDYTLEIPELTDRLKVKAEISQKNVENLTNLIKSGSTASAAVRALDLNSDWLEVAIGIHMQVSEEKAVQATDQSSTPGGTAMPDNSSHAEADGHSGTNCHLHDCHSCTHTHDATNKVIPEFTTEEITEKEIYRILEEFLQSSIHEVIGEGVVLSEAQIAELTEKIVQELIKQADAGANEGAQEIRAAVLGTTSEEIVGILENGGFHVSEEFQERLRNRSEELISRFHEAAREIVRDALDNSEAEGLSAGRIEQRLSEAIPRSRAATIARNEVNYAFRAGHLENDKYLANKYGLHLKKTWRCHRDQATCAICLAMDGKEVELTDAFPDNIQGDDGISYSWERSSWNDDGEIPSAHVNCRCYFETEVVDV